MIGNDTTSHIVDDLEPACNYTFYIVAYMPMGASRMSEQVTQHTLEDGEYCKFLGFFKAFVTGQKRTHGVSGAVFL